MLLARTCMLRGLAQTSAQVVLLYGTLYVIFMVAVWWPVKNYWVRHLTSAPCALKHSLLATLGSAPVACAHCHPLHTPAHPKYWLLSLQAEQIGRLRDSA